MAEFSIKNGNTGDIAKVDSNNRLHVASITEPEADHAADSSISQKYNINTGDVTITNATKLSLLYIKNTGTNDMVVTALIYNLGNTASGTGDVLIEVLRNPNAGSIITNTNDVATGVGVEANSNFGSTNTLTGNFYKGAVGETALSGQDGVYLTTRSSSNTGRIVISLGKLVLPKGSTLGVSYTPPTSNTSQIVQIAAACYIRTTEVSAP